jgi:hypothetical protein
LLQRRLNLISDILVIGLQDLSIIETAPIASGSQADIYLYNLGSKKVSI